MRIGVIGSGRIGATLAPGFVADLGFAAPCFDRAVPIAEAEREPAVLGA
jgi:hypothetical protein